MSADWLRHYAGAAEDVKLGDASDNEGELVWEQAQAADVAGPSGSALPTASAARSDQPESSPIHSRINQVSAERLAGPGNAALHSVLSSEEKPHASGAGVSTSDSALAEAGQVPAPGSIRQNVSARGDESKVSAGQLAAHGGQSCKQTGRRGSPSGQVEHNGTEAHVSNGGGKVDPAAGDSASAAVLRKALLAAEDEVVISDDDEEEEKAEAPRTEHPSTDRHRSAPPAVGVSGSAAIDAAKPAAVAMQASRSAAAHAPQAAPAEVGGTRPGMFGERRPVLENDPEDKMPLIPVLLGRQAIPAAPLKKEESGGTSGEAPATLPRPSAAETTAASSEAQAPASSAAGRQKPPLPRRPGGAAAAGREAAAAADAAAENEPQGQVNGASAPSSAAGREGGERAGQLGSAAPDEDAQAHAAEEDERLREEQGEAAAPESPVQYSRDLWAHDPWCASGI